AIPLPIYVLRTKLVHFRTSAYHHFLTPQMFAAEFVPTAQQQQVKDCLTNQGFTVIRVSSNGVLIDASATVAEVEAAFHIKINCNRQLVAGQLRYDEYTVSLRRAA